MTMQWGDRVEVDFWEAGCMIWVGSLDAYELFCHAWSQREGNVIKTNTAMLQQLIHDRHAVIPLALYQDDGYTTRIVLGELEEREREDWTAKACCRLDLPTGQLVVSGIVDEEGDQAVLALAEVDPEDYLQCYVDVPPGCYTVTIYAYPPHDLSTGWGQIESPPMFSPTQGIEPEEPLAYFHRTRPGEPLPEWLGEDDVETLGAIGNYVNFVVQLLPLEAESTIPTPSLEVEADGTCNLPWEFRKPDRFPLGVRAETST